MILSGLAVAALLCGCGGPKLATANEQLARGEYFDASKTYRKIYNQLTKREDRPLRGEVAFRMGQCHEKLNQFARASAAYQNARRYGFADSTLTLRIARMLHAEGKYAPAVAAYEEYLRYHPDDKVAAERLAGARIALDKAPATRYVVRQPKLFNTRRADYSPVYISEPQEQLYFTSTSEKALGTKKSEITGMKNGDVWVSTKNERGEWQRPQAVEGELNTELDEGIVSFTPDGQTMYLTRARSELNSPTGVEIFTSQRSDAKWGAGTK
ncbi:MAG: tetratricopeptide repeat protein, partial [Muribaculaceae bacterium]|nr:tetratricopeptide repeat protein [Muribaculaceae bacterium]